MRRDTGDESEQDYSNAAATADDKQRRMRQAQITAIDMLAKTRDAMMELMAARQECKLSTMRVGGVARELGELIKVMDIYNS